MSEKAKLTPPDKERCQALISNGVNFMTFGGKRKLERCEEKPIVIAKEKVEGKDGQKGSMSLCQSCLEAFFEQMGQDYADIEILSSLEITTEKTARGFGFIEFKDLYGNGCSLQKSSLATKDAIWLGIQDAKPLIKAKDAAIFGVKTEQTTGWVEYPIPEAVSLTTRMHLDRGQAKGLIGLLQVFVDTGELPENQI